MKNRKEKQYETYSFSHKWFEVLCCPNLKITPNWLKNLILETQIQLKLTILRLCHCRRINKSCNATHQHHKTLYSVNLSSITTENKCKGQTKRSKKAQFHHWEKINALVDQIHQNGLIRQTGSTALDKPTFGTTSLTFSITSQKNYSAQFVYGARYLNYKTDESIGFRTRRF